MRTTTAEEPDGFSRLPIADRRGRLPAAAKPFISGYFRRNHLDSRRPAAISRGIRRWAFLAPIVFVRPAGIAFGPAKFALTD